MNDPNYYQNLKGNLLGQAFALASSRKRIFPLPSEEQIQMYRSLQNSW